MGLEYHDHELPEPSRPNQVNTRIMIAAVVVLFIVVLFILMLHIYARWFWRTARLRSRGRSRWSRRQGAIHFDFATTAAANGGAGTNIASKGLDKSVLESLPVFFYTAKVKGGGLEEDDSQEEQEVLDCAVCLCEFEENEAGRRLPRCNHVFHTGCIDMWFSSNTTCPLCRTSVVIEDDIGSNEAGNYTNADEHNSSTLNRSQGEQLLREAVVSGLNGTNNETSSIANPNGNALAIQILQDEAAVLLTGNPHNQQDHHYIVNVSNSPLSSPSPVPSSSTSSSCNNKFPASVLFWGNHSYVSSSHHQHQQDRHLDLETSPKQQQFRQLVIEVPRRSGNLNVASACSSQMPSPTAEGQRSPLGTHLRNIKRLLSRDSKRCSLDSPAVSDSCECYSTSHTPGSLTPTSQC